MPKKKRRPTEPESSLDGARYAAHHLAARALIDSHSNGHGDSGLKIVDETLDTVRRTIPVLIALEKGTAETKARGEPLADNQEDIEAIESIPGLLMFLQEFLHHLERSRFRLQHIENLKAEVRARKEITPNA